MDPKAEIGRFDSDRHESTAWRAPDGTWFLVCSTEGGYALLAPEECEGEEVAYEADPEGNVFDHGEPLGWRIPALTLQRAREDLLI